MSEPNIQIPDDIKFEVDYRPLGEKVADFFRKLWPPRLQQYIPGQKLIAGLVAYVAAEALGADATAFELPLVGEINIHELATVLAFYLWPTDAPVVDVEKREAEEQSGEPLRRVAKQV